MTSKLQSSLETLYGLERRRSDFRVDDTRRLLAALGAPDRCFRAVHVAGTNGKGSTCALIERVLRAAGFRTGLFTSPHLVDFRERIRVAGRWLDEGDLGSRLEAIQSLPESAGRTFFEIATALGFDAFARHGVEWAVVEVGLGGRLDSTNAMDAEIAAVTAIDLDHTEMLGSTLGAIAREKAAIARPGRPIVHAGGEAEADAAVAETVAAIGGRLVRAGDVVRVDSVRPHASGSSLRVSVEPWRDVALELALRGRHQVDNAIVAVAVLATLARSGVAIPVEALRGGFAAARWPGRLEPCPAEPRLWWDGAHNPAGVERLCAAWREDLGFEPPAAIVFAAARDKDAAAMLASLRRLAPAARLSVARLRHERARPAAALRDAADAAGWKAHAYGDLEDAVRGSLAAAGPGRVLLAGSLFAVGEAMQAFGGAPGECV